MLNTDTLDLLIARDFQRTILLPPMERANEAVRVVTTIYPALDREIVIAHVADYMIAEGL